MSFVALHFQLLELLFQLLALQLELFLGVESGRRERTVAAGLALAKLFKLPRRERRQRLASPWGEGERTGAEGRPAPRGCPEAGDGAEVRPHLGRCPDVGDGAGNRHHLGPCAHLPDCNNRGRSEVRSVTWRAR